MADVMQGLGSRIMMLLEGKGGGGGFRVERSTSTNELHLDVGKPLGILYYTQV